MIERSIADRRTFESVECDEYVTNKTQNQQPVSISKPFVAASFTKSDSKKRQNERMLRENYKDRSQSEYC